MATTNIVSLITQFITPDMVSRASAALGIDRATLQKALGAAVPGVLAAITSILSRPGGAAKIENAINQQPTGLVAEAVNRLGTPQQGAVLSDGLGSITSLLGGNMVSTVTAALNRYAGVGDAGAQGLLGLAAPLIMGVLGQQSPGGSAGITRLLESQKDNIARAMPAGFAQYLSGTGILDELPGAIASQAPRARPASSAESASRNWMLPVLGALALVGLGWYILSRPAPEKTVATQTNTETQMRRPGEATYIVAEEDVGKWVHQPVFSSDNKKIGEVVEITRAPDNKVTEIYLDTESFLGLGGQRYRVTADQIREVKPDGLVLTLTEADVKAAAAKQPNP
jgi:hypothetical protein